MRLPLLLCLLPLPALAQEAPAEWLGPEPHLVLVGTLDGQPVNFDLRGEDATLEARRVYRPGHAGWRYAAVEVRLATGSEDLVFRLNGEDFLQMPAPAWVPVAPLPEPANIVGTFAADLLPAGELLDPGAPGWSGTVGLLLDQGERDAEMLLIEGQVGGYLQVAREADELILSFTAPVVEDAREE